MISLYLAYLFAAAALTFSLIASTKAIYRIIFHPLWWCPGPRAAAATNLYAAYQSCQGRLHLSIWQAHQRYGPVVRLGPTKVAFSSRKALHGMRMKVFRMTKLSQRDIYMSKDVQKVQGYEAMLPAPNAFNTLMTVDKNRHRKRRKIVNQAFSEQAMLAFEPTLHEHINVYLQQYLQSGNSATSMPVDVSQKSRYLALDVMSSFSFGQSLQLQNCDDNRFVSDAIEATSLVCGMYNQWPFLQEIKAGYLFSVAAQTRRKFGKHIGKMMMERVAVEKDSKSDLFAFLLDAQDPESGDKLTLNQLWSESRLMMVAATSLAATFFYLASNRTCYEQLVAHVRTNFASASEIKHGAAFGQRSEYLRACIDEAMRMTPPVGNALWREVGRGGLVVDNRFVPAGTEVGVSLYAIHHDEEVFEDAWSFRPERWMVSDANPQSRIDQMRRSFYPFSLGARRCIAQNFAYMEIMLAVAKTVWYFDFEVTGSVTNLPTGGGMPGRTDGRHRPDEFQTREHLTARTDGPWLRFVCRPGFEDEVTNLPIGAGLSE